MMCCFSNYFVCCEHNLPGDLMKKLPQAVFLTGNPDVSSANSCLKAQLLFERVVVALLVHLAPVILITSTIFLQYFAIVKESTVLDATKVYRRLAKKHYNCFQPNPLHCLSRAQSFFFYWFVGTTINGLQKTPKSI